MKKLHFSIDIKASREKIWKKLWEDESYREWTTSFCEGSYAETDWQEGSEVRFLSPGGGGIFSVIEHNVPNEFMSFRHEQEIKDFKVMPVDENAEKWAGSHENYRLIERDGFTELQVDLDTLEEYASYFEGAWPTALERLKEIAEK